MTQLRTATFIALAALAALLAGCASGETPVHRRGWVGGEFLEVRAAPDWFDATASTVHRSYARRVVGLPPTVEERTGLLVARAAPATPLARAGIDEGDLLLRVDGDPVGDPEDFRDRMEAAPPGSDVTVSYWRQGMEQDAVVHVGTESHHRMLNLSLGISFHPRLDLWPFDDGIDVLGVVVIGTHGPRREIRSVEMDYLAAAYPAHAIALPQQEIWTFRVLPIGFGVGRKVIAQDP